MPIQRIVLASSNAKKINECRTLFSVLGLDVELILQEELNIRVPDEPFGTFIENALYKARRASSLAGLPALADDSGLCVESLGGLPGVYSARFAGVGASDAANRELLLKKMKGLTQRKAHYYCFLVLIRSAEDPRPMIAHGVWSGQIIDEPRGSNGFGYDPLFYIPSLHLTAAELRPVVKNQISHRAQAFKRLMDEIVHF